MKNTLCIGIYTVTFVNSYADRGRENSYIEIPFEYYKIISEEGT